MIRLISDYCSKNNFFAKRRLKLEQEAILHEKELSVEMEKRYLNLKSSLEEGQKDISHKLELLKKENRDIEDMQKRVQDRKVELERVNADLKTQIRLIEAKASPDHVWESAFSQGFSKAWDMMVPLMTQGLEKVKEKIKEQEIENSLPRIDLVVGQKVKELGNKKLVEIHAIEQKKREFIAKAQFAKEEEKKKYENYLHVLDWILGSRNGD